MTHQFDFSEKNTRSIIMNLEIKVESIPLIEQLIAHEIGHAVGMIINDHLTIPFGTPKQISFEQGDPSFKYDYTDEVFRVACREVDRDFYGLKGFEINSYLDCSKTINFINKSYDIERFPAYIGYVIMGGLLHLFSDSKLKGYELDDKHFDDIYSDNDDKDRLSIIGAAGSDWTTVRILCGVYQIDYDFLKTYRKELYNIGLHTGFFFCIYKLIKDIQKRTTPKYLDDELHKLYAEVKAHVESCASFKVFLQKFSSLNQSFLMQIK